MSTVQQLHDKIEELQKQLDLLRKVHVPPAGFYLARDHHHESTEVMVVHVNVQGEVEQLEAGIQGPFTPEGLTHIEFGPPISRRETAGLIATMLKWLKEHIKEA